MHKYWATWLIAGCILIGAAGFGSYEYIYSQDTKKAEIASSKSKNLHKRNKNQSPMRKQNLSSQQKRNLKQALRLKEAPIKSQRQALQLVPFNLTQLQWMLQHLLESTA
ncbi:Uncharacterised protein [Weissella viridescens]|uniref:Uncharacterized protein n=1 Tax=Weissella viridescens TaxID=1629 RepID=A0A380P453_WEIVI|nr:Uncharacterised protein [Weissella viridescens]